MPEGYRGLCEKLGGEEIEETSNSITMTVYSRNRYYLAHLLEFGHAKRNGGGSLERAICSGGRKGNPAVGGRD